MSTLLTIAMHWRPNEAGTKSIKQTALTIRVGPYCVRRRPHGKEKKSQRWRTEHALIAFVSPLASQSPCDVPRFVWHVALQAQIGHICGLGRFKRNRLFASTFLPSLTLFFECPFVCSAAGSICRLDRTDLICSFSCSFAFISVLFRFCVCVPQQWMCLCAFFCLSPPFFSQAWWECISFAFVDRVATIRISHGCNHNNEKWHVKYG